MDQEMEERPSPSFLHDKLINPQFEDLVDVFEDCWEHYTFVPCKLLLDTPHGDVAAMTLLCSYFEGIAGYMRGEDTNNRSKEFFVIGFCNVFSSAEGGIEKAAGAVFKHIRCGLAHEGMLRHKVHYSRMGHASIFVTYPKAKDGTLNTDSEAQSIVVNPLRIYESVHRHFEAYMRDLRNVENVELRCAFEKVVARQWDLNGEDNAIGMTEAEFRG